MISVVMPVHNGEKYLQEAIDSILNQTFTDFEFIILNDGSTDKTEEIILSYDDPRIVYVKNEENLQIVKTLNKGIALAKGKYIARMDADDISMPERLEKQVRYMEEHLEVDVCGSFLDTMGEGVKRYWNYPYTPASIKIALMFYSPLAHPSVIVRKCFFDNARYASAYLKAEDYYLWAVNSKEYEYANIPEVLLHYRLHASQTARVAGDIQLELSNKIRRNLLEDFGVELSDKEFDTHINISRYLYVDMYDAEKWLYKLYQQNKINHLFEDKEFQKFLDNKWWMVINNSTYKGLKAFFYHRNSRVNFYSKSLFQNIKFLIKCLIRYKTKANLNA